MASGRQAELNNHANQCNPNNPSHRGHQPGYQGTGTNADLNNHANQLNPNNAAHQVKKRSTATSDAKANRRPNQKDFRRVRNESAAKAATKDNEVRIVASRGQRMYIKYAIDILNGTDGKSKHDSVILSGMGNAVYNVVNIAEILKRRVKGLHQQTEISSQTMTDKYEAVEAGKEGMQIDRKVSVIEIILSTAPLNKKHVGYQEPLPESEVTEQDERINERRERRPPRAEGGTKDARREDRDAEGGRGGRGGPGRGRDRDAEGGRGGRGGRGRETDREDRAPARGRGGPRREDRDDRPPRRANERRDDRAPARGRGGRDDRPPRRDDRPATAGRDDRPPRRDDRRDDRPPRRDDRPTTTGGRGGRGGYSEGRSERGGRGRN